MRILVIDDNAAIHQDFRKILCPAVPDRTSDPLLDGFLGETGQPPVRTQFDVDSAFQGKEGLERVEEALAEGRPYAMAFVDLRMPPGWDGVETVSRIWARDPALQVVLCTAYSDYSWQGIINHIGSSDGLLILKKPFDNIEVLQLAHAITRKWDLGRQAESKMHDLDRLIEARTEALRSANLLLQAEIAERSAAQEQLHRSEERLSMVFASCPLPIAVMGVFDQVCVQVNPSFVQTTGYPQDEVVGRSLWDAGVCASPEEIEQFMEGLLRGQPTERHECEFCTRSGEKRKGLLWLEPFTLANGPHAMAILQDITEQYALEEQLRQSKKMEALGQLAAGIAHDFNNILTVIHGHTSLRLNTGGLPPDVNDSLKAVLHASDRAAELTRALLAFSRKQVIQKKPICLNGIVQNLTSMLRRLVPEHISLDFRCDPGLPAAAVDVCNIQQVLINLVVNARDAIASTGSITVSTKAVDIDPDRAFRHPDARPGRFVRLTVSDTGQGMDAATTQRIFEPFFTTKDPAHGTGMGLATVDGIVKQHEGWIEVMSVPGKGSTFHVYLPACSSDPEQEQKEATESVRTGRANGELILLAEDDHEVRTFAKRALEEHGFRVLDSRDGTEAYSFWARHCNEIALLLTDMVMPGQISGPQLARRLRSERPDLLVVYTSGYPMEIPEDELLHRRDTHYLPKPYFSSHLIEVIMRAMAQRN